MYPREFDYVAPASLDEALGALGDDAKVMAGGMSLIPLMKMRLFSPAVVVDIGRLPGLDAVEEQNGHLNIGALVRHSTTATNPLITQVATALSTAASLTGDVQVRNRGTTCGAIAHADLVADQPAAALALGATMVAQSSAASREIAAADFFVDALTSALEPNEILTSIRLPKSGSGEASAYEKLGRRGGLSDYAVAAAAAWIKKPDDTIEEARIAVTGVGTKPTLAESAAQALVGTDGSDQAIAEAAEKAVDEVTVIEDLYGSEDYKTHLAKVFVSRAVKKALAEV